MKTSSGLKTDISTPLGGLHSCQVSPTSWPSTSRHGRPHGVQGEGPPGRHDGPGARMRDLPAPSLPGAPVSEEDLKRYESDVELQIYREYHDVLPMFRFVIETERRFYLANRVDLTTREAGGSVFFEIELEDAWVWDMYRPARFLKSVRVLTFRDVNVEEVEHPDFKPPDPGEI